MILEKHKILQFEEIKSNWNGIKVDGLSIILPFKWKLEIREKYIWVTLTDKDLLPENGDAIYDVIYNDKASIMFVMGIADVDYCGRQLRITGDVNAFLIDDGENTKLYVCSK